MQRCPLRRVAQQRKEVRDQEGRPYVGTSFWHPWHYFFPKTCSPTTRLLDQPDQLMKPLLQAFLIIECSAHRSWLEKATFDHRIPFPGSTLEAGGPEERQCWLCGRLCTQQFTRPWQGASFFLASPGGIDLNPQRTETRRQEACVWSGLKVAGMGNPTLCFFPRSLGQVTTLSNPFLIPALVPLASLVSESPDVGRRAIDTSPAGLTS